MNSEDITIAFYYKKAIYNSKITGAKVPIQIKKVEKLENGAIKITSTVDAYYSFNELTDFSL